MKMIKRIVRFLRRFFYSPTQRTKEKKQGRLSLLRTKTNRTRQRMNPLDRTMSKEEMLCITIGDGISKGIR